MDKISISFFSACTPGLAKYIVTSNKSGVPRSEDKQLDQLTFQELVQGTWEWDDYYDTAYAYSSFGRENAITAKTCKALANRTLAPVALVEQ